MTDPINLARKWEKELCSMQDLFSKQCGDNDKIVKLREQIFELFKNERATMAEGGLVLSQVLSHICRISVMKMLKAQSKVIFGVEL